MAQALDDAGLVPAQIAYINLHGTGTPLNDAMESKAVAALFPSSTPCSSTKGMTGHLLGATGGVEAAFLWLALNPATSQGTLPAHLWDGQPDPALPALTMVPAGMAIPRTERRAMLSNSFGFGGNNVSLILGTA
jgi:3-oxoacyl-[acyl-carrier-protein] synthase-1